MGTAGQSLSRTLTAHTHTHIQNILHVKKENLKENVLLTPTAKQRIWVITCLLTESSYSSYKKRIKFNNLKLKLWQWYDRNNSNSCLGDLDEWMVTHSNIWVLSKSSQPLAHASYHVLLWRGGWLREQQLFGGSNHSGHDTVMERRFLLGGLFQDLGDKENDRTDWYLNDFCSHVLFEVSWRMAFLILVLL